MTKKRFTYEYDEYNGNLFDNKMDTFYHIEDSDENIEVLCDRLNWLVEENEQLKKRNDRQAKQLDRLYNLIEEKDWRTLTDILDDFKRCEEQLQREWGTYGDVE